jgi:energy-coupling factor transport system permease protein
MNARAVAAWSAACLFIVLFTTNPAYKSVVLVAALGAVYTGSARSRLGGLLKGVAFIAMFAVLLNFISAHLGTTVLFGLPPQIPGLGGPYTLEALAYGATGGVTIAAAILAAAPLSLMLKTHEVMDALPEGLSRTGAAIAASLNLVPSVATSFAQVGEAQRLRGWRPREPRSWAEVIVPVVLTSVEGSIQLAESMEARGFGSGRRTAMSAAPMGRSGRWLVGTSLVAVLWFILARNLGWAADWAPYPTLALPALDLLALAPCLLLFTPVWLWRSRA